MSFAPCPDELVAVKSVDATRFRSIGEIEQVQEEMAVLSALKHPNIIRLQVSVDAENCTPQACHLKNTVDNRRANTIKPSL
jgi:hypothetical protein